MTGHYLLDHPFVQGVFLGLSLAILWGPGFVALVQTSIGKGIRFGLFLGVGIFLGDLVVLSLCHFGIGAAMKEYSGNTDLFGIFGGMFLMGFGMHILAGKSVRNEPGLGKENGIRGNRPCPHTSIWKGFFLNTLNPGIWFLWTTAWFTIGTFPDGGLMFLAGLLSTTLMTDFAKCLIAGRFQLMVPHEIAGRMNLVAGMLLMAYGMVLVGKAMLPSTFVTGF